MKWAKHVISITERINILPFTISLFFKFDRPFSADKNILLLINILSLEMKCKIKNKIEKISYIHIDTQGNDLKVLKGLKKKIKIIEKGVLEAAVNKKISLYQNTHTVNEVQKFLKKNNFNISKIVSAEKNISNEKNIFFYNKSINSKNLIKTKYNLAHFERIISKSTHFLDYLINKVEK